MRLRAVAAEFDYLVGSALCEIRRQVDAHLLEHLQVSLMGFILPLFRFVRLLVTSTAVREQDRPELPCWLVRLPAFRS